MGCKEVFEKKEKESWLEKGAVVVQEKEYWVWRDLAEIQGQGMCNGR